MTNLQPLFSIIVPTHDRPRDLRACLRSLALLDYPQEQFEVIVVDDGSTVPPDHVVAEFCDRLHVALVKQSRTGPAGARNTGATRARGRFLAFTDDDCAPAPNWLRGLEASFLVAPDHLIGGRTFNALPNNPYSSVSQLIINVVYTHYNAASGSPRFFACNNLALPAAPFRAIGGFDSAFVTSEDREFCDRWLQHRYSMTYAPQAVVYHSRRLTFTGFWQQHFNYGRGAYRFHRIRAKRGSGRFKVQPGFYLRLLRSASCDACWRSPALLAVSQLANVSGCLWEAARRR